MAEKNYDIFCVTQHTFLEPLFLECQTNFGLNSHMTTNFEMKFAGICNHSFQTIKGEDANAGVQLQNILYAHYRIVFNVTILTHSLPVKV